jgi:hypothetical protein
MVQPYECLSTASLPVTRCRDPVSDATAFDHLPQGAKIQDASRKDETSVAGSKIVIEAPGQGGFGKLVRFL